MSGFFYCHKLVLCGDQRVAEKYNQILADLYAYTA